MVSGSAWMHDAVVVMGYDDCSCEMDKRERGYGEAA